MKLEPKYKVGDTLINKWGLVFIVESVEIRDDEAIWYYYPYQNLGSIATQEYCCHKLTKLDKALR